MATSGRLAQPSTGRTPSLNSIVPAGIVAPMYSGVTVAV
jgi:hypothetical protein